MKGIVFTELLEYVGSRFGENAVDDMIEAAGVPSGGAYTSVGTYSHGEMIALCVALSEQTRVPVPELIRDFGDRLSNSFARDFPAFYQRAGNLFDFLTSIEDHIHIEVRKLYPDAELPTFTVESRTDARLVIRYESPRKMGHLSEGLIIGSARQYGVPVTVRSTELHHAEEGMAVRFEIVLA
jgi:hypothetical protein